MKKVICPSCKKKIDLTKYSINPHSHVEHAITCECGAQIRFIPDADCHIIK